MVVKILSSSATFSGVIYNTDKVDRNKGELMLVRNFGSLQGFSQLRPEDYRNYLKMLSRQNSRIIKPQFHAAISAKGKSYDKEALTAIAVQWLEAMGYGAQPYLVVFHKDTDNHHMHVVTTRVGRDGKKISSAFERIRAVSHLNRIMGTDILNSAANDIRNALSYHFSTRAQFMMILERGGYTLRAKDDVMQVIKFGQLVDNVSFRQIDARSEQYQKNEARQRQLKAIFEKYSLVYRTALTHDEQPLPGGRTERAPTLSSDLSRFLDAKFGLKLVFHAKVGKPAYGYSIIDHTAKAVWKGSKIMPLIKLLERKGPEQFDKRSAEALQKPEQVFLPVKREAKQFYAALLKAAIWNYPDVKQGLHDLGLSLNSMDSKIYLVDPAAEMQVPVEELTGDLDAKDHAVMEAYAAHQGYNYVPPVSIAADIDDEQINGRNRRRKKKARTNTR